MPPATPQRIGTRLLAYRSVSPSPSTYIKSYLNIDKLDMECVPLSLKEAHTHFICEGSEDPTNIQDLYARFSDTYQSFKKQMGASFPRKRYRIKLVSKEKQFGIIYVVTALFGTLTITTNGLNPLANERFGWLVNRSRKSKQVGMALLHIQDSSISRYLLSIVNLRHLVNQFCLDWPTSGFVQNSSASSEFAQSLSIQRPQHQISLGAPPEQGIHSGQRRDWVTEQCRWRERWYLS